MAEPTVGEIMDRDPVTASPATDVLTLIRLLRQVDALDARTRAGE